MDPLTMSALIMGGTSLASGIMGMGAANDASENNSAIADFNMREGVRNNWLRMALAKKEMEDRRLGTTDQYGTRTHFIPGVGVVTEPGEEIRALQNLGTANQMYQAGPAELARRKLAETENRGAMTEANYGDRLMEDMKRTVTPDRRDMRLSGLGSAMAARARGVDKAVNTAAATAQKTGAGSSNYTDMMSKIAGQAGEDYMAGGTGTGGASPTRDLMPNTANLYGAMRARAGAAAQGATIPQISVPSGGADAGSMMPGMGTPVQATPGFQPDMGPANLISNLGQIAAGGVRDYAAQQQNNRLIDALTQRGQTQPQLPTNAAVAQGSTMAFPMGARF